MTEVCDMELLRNYVQQGSEPAFAELVRRHLNLVYSVALRHTQAAAQAEEISQIVFTILARNAATLRPGTILEGWLHETTRLTALSFLRGEHRRQFREQEAYMQSTPPASPAPETWNQLAPFLDEAISQLGKKDRDAVMLRFFAGKSVREVAAGLSINEAAAQRRVHRAVEKLRRFFTKRGVAHSAVVLTSLISAHSVQAAPAGLAQAVTIVAAAKGVAAGGSTLSLVKGALKLMAWTKAKTTIVVGTSLLLVLGPTTFQAIRYYEMYAWRSHGITNASIASLDTWPPQVWIAPAKDRRAGNQLGKNEAGKLMGRNTPFSWLLRNAYGKTQPWMVLPEELKDDRGFDYMANLSQGSAEALQQAINQYFGIVVKRELRETNVLVLKPGKTGAFGVKPSAQATPRERASDNTLSWTGQPFATFTIFMEGFLHQPILDQTGLTGKFDFALQWDNDWWSANRDHPEGMEKVIADQLGLELVATNLPIAMLVVEKVK